MLSRLSPSSAKDVVRALVPPALLTLGKEVRRRVRGAAHTWEYVPEGWAERRTASAPRGWNVSTIPTLHARHWREFAAAVESPHPLSVAPEHALNPTLAAGPYRDVDIYTHHVAMTVAYALALTARGRTSLSVLDWGGGVGHYALLFRALFPDLTVDYSVRDMPAMTAEGRRLLPTATFYDDDTCFDRTYDFVVSSSSIQYARDWQDALARLGRAADGYLFVSQIPMVHRAPSFVVIQRPYDNGYNTEYLGWCFNRPAFLEAARAAGLTLEREFLHGFKPDVHGAPEQPEYRGYLFRPAAP
jgi:putative methyltransferase (TIGR04325 family)